MPTAALADEILLPGNIRLAISPTNFKPSNRLPEKTAVLR
jgi:hypothetical protein